MKLLLDQNLSHRLADRLATNFPDSKHVRDVELASSPDAGVWAYATKRHFVIVSKDTDFQQRALLYGHPPEVIWIRSGNCSTAAVVNLLRSRVADLCLFESDTAASFLALS